MRILFPWIKKKIKKALSKEVRRKYGQKIDSFDYIRHDKNNIASYILILADGSVVHASVNYKKMSTCDAIMLSC